MEPSLHQFHSTEGRISSLGLQAYNRIFFRYLHLNDETVFLSWGDGFSYFNSHCFHDDIHDHKYNPEEIVREFQLNNLKEFEISPNPNLIKKFSYFLQLKFHNQILFEWCQQYLNHSWESFMKIFFDWVNVGLFIQESPEHCSKSRCQYLSDGSFIPLAFSSPNRKFISNRIALAVIIERFQQYSNEIIYDYNDSFAYLIRHLNCPILSKSLLLNIWSRGLNKFYQFLYQQWFNEELLNKLSFDQILNEIHNFQQLSIRYYDAIENLNYSKQIKFQCLKNNKEQKSISAGLNENLLNSNFLNESIIHYKLNDIELLQFSETSKRFIFEWNGKYISIIDHPSLSLFELNQSILHLLSLNSNEFICSGLFLSSVGYPNRFSLIKQLKGNGKLIPKWNIYSRKCIIEPIELPIKLIIIPIEKYKICESPLTIQTIYPNFKILKSEELYYLTNNVSNEHLLQFSKQIYSLFKTNGFIRFEFPIEQYENLKMIRFYLSKLFLMNSSMKSSIGGYHINDKIREGFDSDIDWIDDTKLIIEKYYEKQKINEFEYNELKQWIQDISKYHTSFFHFIYTNLKNILKCLFLLPELYWNQENSYCEIVGNHLNENCQCNWDSQKDKTPIKFAPAALLMMRYNAPSIMGEENPAVRAKKIHELLTRAQAEGLFEISSTDVQSQYDTVHSLLPPHVDLSLLTAQFTGTEPGLIGLSANAESWINCEKDLFSPEITDREKYFHVFPGEVLSFISRNRIPSFVHLISETPNTRDSQFFFLRGKNVSLKRFLSNSNGIQSNSLLFPSHQVGDLFDINDEFNYFNLISKTENQKIIHFMSTYSTRRSIVKA